MLSWFRRNKVPTQHDTAVIKSFRKRYAYFRVLLQANAGLAELMADISLKLEDKALFDAGYITATAARAVHLARRMANSLIAMHPGRYSGLLDAITRAEAAIGHSLEESDCAGACAMLTVPLSAVDTSVLDWVGGKNAHLGEMRNHLHLAVPRGFAITTTAFQRFMDHEGLGDAINTLLVGLNPDDREGLGVLLQQVREAIVHASLPPVLVQALEEEWRDTFGEEPVRVAVRSSGRSEDGDKSFAGQFLSVMNVPRHDLGTSYKRVVASLFSPSATLYRLHQGIALSANPMAVACLEMVPAVASGIAYSHSPTDIMKETVLIHGIFGLGHYLVNGMVSPDVWVFSRSQPPALLRRRASNKEVMQTIDAYGNVCQQPIEEGKQRSFCLTDEEAQELAEHVLRLEAHYGCYQDAEWAKNASNQLVMLQTRPLEIQKGARGTPKPPRLEGHTIMCETEDIAFHGVGAGLVAQPQTAQELTSIPEGCVLVVRHSRSEYTQVMDKVQAIIAETGSITGHMAILCREFRVPCLLNVPEATKLLPPGMAVTVDAFNGLVYQGTMEELLPLRLQIGAVRLHNTPVHKQLHELARHILPLHLTDPEAAEFSPQGCSTLHDVMRYAHERSYLEMFTISDSATHAEFFAKKLEAPLPIDLHIIDLDKGTTAGAQVHSVRLEHIVCAPLKAMLGGMLRPDTQFRAPRPVNMSGFLSVMSQQMVSPQGGKRFGDKSYAIVSDKYMNFSSRVGYHYSVIDAYCGNTVNKNYASFRFQGGAAGEERRVRRCRAIAMVLQSLGFTVTQKGDMVSARYAKYPKEQIEEIMDQLGRLLQVTRQMDMLMVNEASIAAFHNDFMNGVYR